MAGCGLMQVAYTTSTSAGCDRQHATRYCRSCMCAVCPLRHHKPSFVFVLVPGTSLRSGERLCADSGWAYSTSPHLALCTALPAEVVPRRVKAVGRRTADFWKRRFRRSHWYLHEHSCKKHCGTFAAQLPTMWAMTWRLSGPHCRSHGVCVLYARAAWTTRVRYTGGSP